eukprot:CAMPEP_0198691234 /NCGR_PEP_ID=MMETSP1468-20131203/198948_1 /TAXON_ID=1461545 /ORGANISM="Mantoniella sp, Strain CCMP1436" /LENGTH=104 /DNA_ID=CAMNT_0044444267 /DNA_START=32 /DNA_END=342 /DNA_ORIENTATION=+
MAATATAPAPTTVRSMPAGGCAGGADVTLRYCLLDDDDVVGGRDRGGWEDEEGLDDSEGLEEVAEEGAFLEDAEAAPALALVAASTSPPTTTAEVPSPPSTPSL